VVALLLTLILTALLWWLLRPQRLADLVELALAARSGAIVQIERAELTGPGQLTLHNARLDARGAPAAAKRLLQVPRLEVHFTPKSLLAGRFNLTRLILHEPTLDLTENLDTGRYNYEWLPGRTDGKGPLPADLPAVTLHEGEIRFNQIEEGRYRRMGTAPVAGALGQAGGPGQHQFVLRQLDRATGPGREQAPDIPHLTGEVDLHAPSLSITLERFSFDGPHQHLLPSRFRQWWHRLDPAGTLATARIHIRGDQARGLHLHRASLEIDETALTLPPEWLDGRANAPGLRLDHVAGRLTLENETLVLDGVTARLANIPCRLNGTFRGLTSDAPFTLTAETEPFALPRRPEFLENLPEAVREAFAKFNPAGRFQGRLRLKRDRPAGRINADGLVRVLGARMRFHKFPYPVRRMRGRLSFTDRRVTFNLTGHGPRGARLSVRNGLIAPPGEDPRVEMTIQARNGLIGQPLLNAMKPEHRQALGLFFSRQTLENFHHHRQIQTASLLPTPGQNLNPLYGIVPDGRVGSKPPTEAASDAALGGRIPYAEIQIHRPVGPDKDTRVVTTLETRGLTALFQHWPYPVRSTGGRLQISKRRIVAENVRLRGPTGASATIAGHVTTTDGQRPGLTPALSIRDLYIPIDPLLQASLPRPQNHWLARLHLQGHLLGDGRIYRDEAGRLDWQLNARLLAGQARPYAGRYRLTGITGRARLTRDRLTLDQLTGDGPGSDRIAATGAAEWAGAEPAFDFQLQGQNIELHPRLLDLLRPAHPGRQRLAQACDRHHPAGRTDFQLDYQQNPDHPTGDYTLALQPRRLRFDYQGHRFRLDEMTGSARIDAEQLALDGLAGRHSHGQFEITGRFDREEATASLRFAGASDELSPAVRALLPQPARETVEDLSLTGGFTVNDGRLEFDTDRQWHLKLPLQLNDMSASFGAPITDLTGRLAVTAERAPQNPQPRLELKLEADRLAAWGRSLDSLRARLQRDADSSRFQFDHLRGRMNGGVVTGDGWLDPAGGYDLTFTLRDVGLGSIADPENDATADADANTTKGRLTAGLHLADDPDPAVPRRGRGSLQIRRGRLFQQPLAMALLQTANLTLPTAESFDRAAARFAIRGQTVRLDLLTLEAPSLAITGRGTMKLPDGRLDLAMVTRHPAPMDLGPFSELLNVFKDELIAVHLEGTLEEPRARAVSLQGLRETWQAILRSRHEYPDPEPVPSMPFRQ